MTESTKPKILTGLHRKSLQTLNLQYNFYFCSPNILNVSLLFLKRPMSSNRTETIASGLRRINKKLNHKNLCSNEMNVQFGRPFGEQP